MNKTKFHFQHFILIMCLIMTAMPSLTFADAAIEKQKADCIKNTAYEWSNTLNRCVGKTAAREKRHEAQDCNKIDDVAQREACHLRVAEKATGLSSDTGSLNQGNTTGTMALGTVFMLASLLMGSGPQLVMSACTSKKIFGITAVAGIASDLYLKYSAKKKVEELGNKYKLDAKSSASNSQVKALEYLKEEQQTVADIAALEKKRNMLIMAGYAVAGAFAVYEIATQATTPNPACFPEPEAPAKDPKKPDKINPDEIKKVNEGIQARSYNVQVT